MTQKQIKLLEKNVNDKIKSLSEALKYRHVEPNIVQPANVYFDLLGDNLRRRLYLVQDALSNNNAQDFVLRPEFTICVAREYLQNSNTKNKNKSTRLSYSGPVFRADKKTGDCKEFVQTGIEIFAANNPFAADIEVLEYSLKATDILNMKGLQLALGDYDLFFTLLQNLDISDIWRKKLKRIFLSNNVLDDLMKQIKKPQTTPINSERAAFLEAIEGLDVNAAQMLVENVLSFSGIDLIGGRSAGEIAQRFLEQAALSATPNLPDEIVTILSEYFAIHDNANIAVNELTAFNKKYQLRLDNKIWILAKRISAISELDISNFNKDTIVFSTLLGRGFEYYTGMVFEIIDASNRVSAPLIAGGRYDSLVKQLGANNDVNAVGASLWDSRIANLQNLDGETA